MHLTIDRADLLAALRRGGQLSGRAKSVPILDCVIIRAKEGGLTVASSDTSQWASLSVPAAVSAPGDAAVNGAMLTKAVSELPTGKVDIALDDGLLRVSQGRTKLRFPALPASDYPAASPVRGPVMTIAAGELRRVGDATTWAASTEEARAHLCVTCLRPADGALQAWATDSHVMVRTGVAGQGDIPTSDIMLPVAAWAPLRALLDGASDDEPVEVTIGYSKPLSASAQPSPNGAAFRIGGARFRTGLTNGSFPDNMGWLVTNALRGEIVLEFDRDALAAALRRVRVAAEGKASSIRLDISTDGVTVVAGGTGGVSAEDWAEASGSGDLSIGFGSKLLGSALGAMPAGRIAARFTDRASPVVLWPVGTGPDEAALLALVMPQRV
ncbi:hypothetical protein GAY29_07350 [Azospirillum brasilense]|uniref:DNA polymerase III subunit beta n=1 Tax=Azospirillum brasilense TaxID=192 RepID=UPI001909DC2F|nr:hypothetical protein [Azospirillum brasilense]MBK3732926.1 hypothetical protein [Azospirillum brasilense]